MIIKKAFSFLTFAVIFLIIFLPGYTRIQELRDKNKDLLDKNKRLQAENALLGKQLKRMENDQVYQEKVLREKMGVVRKNEIPVKIVPLEPQKKN